MPDSSRRGGFVVGDHGAKQIDVSIIVCTRNHCRSLSRTLESIAGLIIPAGLECEVLVVDNGSTDETRDVVGRAEIPSMAVRCIYEPKAGLSHARNRGVTEAAGRVLLWTDDDVEVPPHWLVDMSSPILEGRADAVCGAVDIPQSIRQSLEGTALDNRLGWVASTENVDFTTPTYMIGASMAFGRHVLEHVPRFDVILGPGPSSLGFSDDILFSRQLLATGHRIIGVTTCPVLHYFDSDRCTLPVILSMARRMGRSHGYYSWHWRNQERRGRAGRLIGVLGEKTRLRVVAALILARRLHRQAVSDARRMFTGQRLQAEEEVLGEFWRGFRSEYAKSALQPPKYNGAGR